MLIRARRRARGSVSGRSSGGAGRLGHNLASRAGDLRVKLGTGKYMVRTTSTRALRVCVLGLATLTTAIIFTTDSADARRHRHHVRHYQERSSYSPAFSSIIVDGNS